jgi:hypothetical protein
MIDLFYPPTLYEIHEYFSRYPHTIRSHGSKEADPEPLAIDEDTDQRAHNASERRVALIMFLRTHKKHGAMTIAQIRYHGGFNNAYNTTRDDLNYLANNNRIGKKGDAFWALT